MEAFAYSSGTTVLHKMNPVTKILVSVCICAACFLTNRLPVLCSLIAIGLLLGCIGKTIGKTVKIFKGLVKVCLFLFLLQVLFVRTGNRVLFFATDEGILLAARVALRLMGATLPLAVVLSVTKLEDLANALVRVFHLPYKYAFTFTSAIRFIPAFLEDMKEIMEAQIARGVEIDTKNPYKKIKLILPLCIPLLIGSVRKADFKGMAVEARGIELRNRDSGYRTYPFIIHDYVAASCSLSVILAVSFLR